MLSSLVTGSKAAGRLGCMLLARSMASVPSSQLDELLRRLDALESRVNEALGQGQALNAEVGVAVHLHCTAPQQGHYGAAWVTLYV